MLKKNSSGFKRIFFIWDHGIQHSTFSISYNRPSGGVCLQWGYAIIFVLGENESYTISIKSCQVIYSHIAQKGNITSGTSLDFFFPRTLTNNYQLSIRHF